MAEDRAKTTGPGLAKGIPASDLAEGGMLVGHAQQWDEIAVEVAMERQRA